MLRLLFSLPKVIWFNFRYLPFKLAVKLPIFLTYDTQVNIKGTIYYLGPLKMASVRIGFHRADGCNKSDETQLVVRKYGKLTINGTAHIGNGSKIIVDKKASLSLGDNFAISASSKILCYKQISFGSDIQLSWGNVIMDSDTHAIYDKDGKIINLPKSVFLDNKIWTGCNVLILKGIHIPSNCVIGANSILSINSFNPNSIIAGCPAKSIKEIGGFIID